MMLSIPKKALLTKPRSPTTCVTGIILMGARLGFSTQLNVHLRDFFLAFGGNVWWPLLWWAWFCLRMKPKWNHNIVPFMSSSLGSRPDDLSRGGPPCVESWSWWTLSPQDLSQGSLYGTKKSLWKLLNQHFICENSYLWIGIVLVEWGRVNSSALNYGVVFMRWVTRNNAHTITSCSCITFCFKLFPLWFDFIYFW